MWQFQWMLSLIPDAILNWLYWAIIAIGLTGLFAGWLGKFIPLYGKYVGILKPIGIALLVLGVWLRGGYDTEMAWRDKVANLESKVKISEEKSKEANTKIVTKVVVKREYYRTRGEDIVQYVDREITKYDNTCPIPKEVVKAHNDAASPGDKK